MEELSRKRFVRALRAAQELLIGEARCYCYSHEKEYQEVVEDLKCAIRMLEDGEDFAGKLLYKNAAKISCRKAKEMSERAKDPSEKGFWVYLSAVNRQ